MFLMLQASVFSKMSILNACSQTIPGQLACQDTRKRNFSCWPVAVDRCMLYLEAANGQISFFPSVLFVFFVFLFLFFSFFFFFFFFFGSF